MDAAPASSWAGLDRDPHRGPSRRAVLLWTTAALAAGAGGGAALAARQTVRQPRSAPAPPELVAALQAEYDLISAIDAASGSDAAGSRAAATGVGHARLLAGVRADHVAHAGALRASLSGYPSDAAASTAGSSGSPSPAASSTSSGAPGTPSAISSPAPGITHLRAGEQQASRTAAARAIALSGPDAALLASIAASEATHAQVLA